MTAAAQPVLVSVHDVMPQTLPQVRRILALLKETGAAPANLLVCPGFDWTDTDTAVLRDLVAEGHHIAGHGWRHRVDRVRGWRHRLHAALISRNVAEHLALDAAGVADLMARCHDWFPAHGLPAPTLYVPPAWALGPADGDSLRTLPFRWVETLLGFTDITTGRFVPVPLAGYEADTTTRAVALRLLNAASRLAARALCMPLRIAIHPDDLDLRLGEALKCTLRGRLVPLALEEALHRPAGETAV